LWTTTAVRSGKRKGGKREASEGKGRVVSALQPLSVLSIQGLARGEKEEKNLSKKGKGVDWA